MLLKRKTLKYLKEALYQRFSSPNYAHF